MNRIVLMVLRNFWKVPRLYGKLCHYAKHTDKYPEEEKYNLIRYILQTAVKSGNIDLQVHGEENIPKENGYLMVANHQGMFDILAIVATCKAPMAAVLKQELYKYPFMKQLVDCTGSYPMDREDIRQSMGVIVSVTKEIKNGRNFLIFPEGTRSKNGNEMLEFHGGSFKCATKVKAPILPMALIDSYKVLDQKGSAPVAVQLHFLEPVTYEEYKDMSTMELAAMVRERIGDVIQKYSKEVSETDL